MLKFKDLELKDISFKHITKYEWVDNKLACSINKNNITKDTMIKLIYHWFPDNYTIPDRETIRNHLKKKEFYEAFRYSYKLKKPILEYIEVYFSDGDINDPNSYLCHIENNLGDYFKYVEEILELVDDQLVRYKI